MNIFAAIWLVALAKCTAGKRGCDYECGSSKKLRGDEHSQQNSSDTDEVINVGSEADSFPIDNTSYEQLRRTSEWNDYLQRTAQWNDYLQRTAQWNDYLQRCMAFIRAQIALSQHQPLQLPNPFTVPSQNEQVNLEQRYPYSAINQPIGTQHFAATPVQEDHHKDAPDTANQPSELLRFPNHSDFEGYFSTLKRFMKDITSKKEFMVFVDTCALDEVAIKDYCKQNLDYLKKVKFGPALKEFFYEKLFSQSKKESETEKISEESEINRDKASSSKQSNQISEELMEEVGIDQAIYQKILSLKECILVNTEGTVSKDKIEEFLDPVIFFLVRDSLNRFENDARYRGYFIPGFKAPGGCKVPLLITKISKSLENLLLKPGDFKHNQGMARSFFQSETNQKLRDELINLRLNFLKVLHNSLLKIPEDKIHTLDTVNLLFRLRYSILSGVRSNLKILFMLKDVNIRNYLYKSRELPIMLLFTFLDFKKVEDYMASNRKSEALKRQIR